MIYHTKVDAGGPVILLLLAALPAVMGVIILVGLSATDLGGWILLMLSPALLWLLLLFAWPVTYDPGATRADGEPILLVRVGRFLRYEIPIADIREVKPKSSIALLGVVVVRPARSHVSHARSGRLPPDLAAGPRRIPRRTGPPRRAPGTDGRPTDAAARDARGLMIQRGGLLRRGRIVM